jgi:hypothetical protein
LTSRARAFPVLFELADCPPAPCGLSARRQFIPVRRDVLCVLVLIRFCFSFRCSWFADGPSFSSGRSRSRADGLPGLRGRSVFSVHFWWFCWLLWTVRGSWPDYPRGLCGQSAPPGRTVRLCLAALLLGSIPPSFISCFRVCFKESFLRLEVDP